MKQYLLPQNGNFYRANMHCHSLYSDGKLTIEELKRLYKDAGYSIVAFTDHNVLIDHSYLNDEDFLALTGVEINVTDKTNDRLPCFHMNFYAKDPHNTAMPCYSPEWAKPKLPIPEPKYIGSPDYVRDYFKVNEIIAEYVKNGFICCYNHPTWSLQDIDDYRDIEGIFAMEIYNHGCYTMGYFEINSHAYDDLLRRGKRIFCIASDDNHNKYPVGTPRYDSLGGYIMIKSPTLSYGDIIAALENGDFYSSTGPEIYEMYREGDELHIKTSPAARIAISGYGRTVSSAVPERIGETITEAVIPIRDTRYFRVTVDDGCGHFAWSNAYFGD